SSSMYHLVYEIAFDPRRDVLSPPQPASLTDEYKVGLSLPQIAKQPQHPNHRVIVEGDVRLVTLSERVILWPAAVIVLGREQIINTFQERVAMACLMPGPIGARQERELSVSSGVINRRIAGSFFFE